MWKSILFLGILLVGFSFGAIVSKSGLDFSEGKFLGFSILGVIGILISVYKLRFLKRQTVAQERTNKLTERRLSQERFRAAVEHLRNSEGSAYIAALYENSNLASTHRKKYGQIILDILCGHLRQKTDYSDTLSNEIKHSEEVRTLVEILFGHGTNFYGLQFNLSRVNLTGMNFQHKIMHEKINFESANLIDVVFPKKANLHRACFRKANLYRVDLVGANLMNADLKNANLLFANLRGANFLYADLRNADLCNADLSDAENLKKAKLKDADWNWGTKFPEGFKPEEHGMYLDIEYGKSNTTKQ